ncbi:MAG: hypothetical protein RLZZ373_2052 [Pseudomonadota bacterium]
MGIDITSRQALDQSIDAGPCRCQPGAQIVPFGRDGGELLVEQRVGALQLFVAQQQPVYPFGEVFECGHCAVAVGVVVVIGATVRAP